MLLGILIRTYNSSQTIAKALVSLSIQTDQNFIVQIYDDGSDDINKLHETVNQFKNLNISIYHHNTNRGRGISLKYGIQELLKNKDITHVIMLDSDDNWKRNDVIETGYKYINIYHDKYDVYNCGYFHCEWFISRYVFETTYYNPANYHEDHYADSRQLNYNIININDYKFLNYAGYHLASSKVSKYDDILTELFDKGMLNKSKEEFEQVIQKFKQDSAPYLQYDKEKIQYNEALIEIDRFRNQFYS